MTPERIAELRADASMMVTLVVKAPELVDLIDQHDRLWKFADKVRQADYGPRLADMPVFLKHNVHDAVMAVLERIDNELRAAAKAALTPSPREANG